MLQNEQKRVRSTKTISSTWHEIPLSVQIWRGISWSIRSSFVRHACLEKLATVQRRAMGFNRNLENLSTEVHENEKYKKINGRSLSRFAYRMLEVQVSKHKENNWFLSSFQCLLCSWWLEQEIIGLLHQRRFRLVTREEPCNRKDYRALEEIEKEALQKHMANRLIPDDNVLGQRWILPWSRLLPWAISWPSL